MQAIHLHSSVFFKKDFMSLDGFIRQRSRTLIESILPHLRDISRLLFLTVRGSPFTLLCFFNEIL